MKILSKLLRNEIIKASRKPFYIVIVALTLATVIGAAGVMMLAYGEISTYEIDYWDEEDYAYAKEDAEVQIEDYTKILSTEITYEDLMQLEEAVKTVKRFEAVDTFDIDLGSDEYQFMCWGYYSTGTKNEYIMETLTNLIAIYAYEDTAERMDKIIANGTIDEYDIVEAWKDACEVNYNVKAKASYEEIIKAKDFSKYIDFENASVSASTEMTQEQKDITIENNNLLKKIYTDDITDDAWYDISTKIQTLTGYRTQIANANVEGNKLSEEELNDAKMAVAEIELGLEKHAMGYGGTQTSTYSSIISTAITFGIEIVGIFAVIMGALLIAEEIQSGSIKALIVAPCSRRKIFSAKLLVLLITLAFEAALVYLGFLISNLIFGLGSSPIVFTFMGKACCLNYYLYYLLMVVLSMVEPIVHGIFALMLSTLFRNTGAAMSIALCITQVVNGIVQSIASFFSGQVAQTAVKFLPTSNFDIASKVFITKSETTMYFDYGTSASNSWQFAIIYDVILVALMIFTSYQSFEKRDIK